MSDLEQEDAQILKPKRGSNAKLTDEQKEEKRLAVLEKHAKKLAEAKDKRLGKNNVIEVKAEEKVEEKVVEPAKQKPKPKSKPKPPVQEEEEEESEYESEPEPEPRVVKAPAKKKPVVKAPAVKKPAPNIGTKSGGTRPLENPRPTAECSSSKTSFTDQQRNVKKKKAVVYESESSDSESDSETDEEVIVKKPRGKAPQPQPSQEIRRCKFF